MKAPDKVSRRWAIRWESKNQLDGHQVYITPSTYPTRTEARAARDRAYGYIRTRQDLQREPHGWKVPRVVRVTVTVKED